MVKYAEFVWGDLYKNKNTPLEKLYSSWGDKIKLAVQVIDF
jgi:hypothetical protein